MLGLGLVLGLFSALLDMFPTWSPMFDSGFSDYNNNNNDRLTAFDPGQPG